MKEVFQLSACILAVIIGAAVAASSAGAGKVIASHSGLCLEGPGGRAGRPLQQSACDGSASQAFELRRLAGDEAELALSASGLCVDVEGESKQDGAKLMLYRCHGKANQRFLLRVESDGSMQLVAKHSGKCVDVLGESKVPGANIVQWACHGGANQRFRFEDGVSARPSPPPTAADRRRTGLAEMPPRLAIIPSVPHDPPPSVETLLAAFDTAYAAGARGTYVAYNWAQLEPNSGRYDGLGEFKNALDFLSQRFDLFLHLEVVKTTVKETPSDLRREPFDSEKMRSRFLALLDRVVPLLPPQVRTLTIGTEADVYFAAHGEFEQYKRFFEAAVQHVHRTAPGLPVGVSFTFEETQGSQRQRLEQLRDLSDFAEITYYALGDRFRPRGPAAPTTDVPKILAFAGNKPLLLEVGYASSPSLGSSEGDQATFLNNVLGLWRIHRERVPVLNVFELHDESPSTCAAEAKYYGAGAEREAYVAFRCSLGLKRPDGSPKAAWATLQKAAKP